MVVKHPSAARAADPRALLQRGLAESHRGEVRSLQTLAAAIDASVANDDATGAALGAAAALITGQILCNYRGGRDRLARLRAVLDAAPDFTDPDLDLLAHAGLLCGLLFYGPGDPALGDCAKRVMALLERDIDVNLRFAAGRLLLYYSEPRESREQGQRIYSLLQPLMDDPDLRPHRLGRFLTFWIGFTAAGQDRTQSERARAQLRELNARHGESEFVFFLGIAEFEAALRSGDVATVDRVIATVEASSDPANLYELGRIAWLKGRAALAHGEGDAALFHATRARKLCEELEVPAPMLGVRYALEAQARLQAGDFEGARVSFRKTADMVAALHADEMLEMIGMVDAYEALQVRDPRGRELLAAAFAAPRARQFYDTFDTNPRFGATMCALALELGVETEFARRIVEVHSMAPPAEAGDAWPWPVRIATLGRFELVRDGAVLAVAGKTQKKPLEVLKALVAGGGRAVDKQRLAESLWPDSEPDAASAAFDMAISRLRKLLALPEAVRIVDGKVGLDPALAWVDVWSFDRDVEALQTALHDGAAGDASHIEAIGRRLLAIYRGPFLDNEEPQRWLLGARDRWHNRFVRSLADAGRYWERSERWPEAIALYERGIEVDTLAEDLYRRLIHCHLALGQPAEAARVYRRCREMLSVQLGISPSAETEALFQAIYKR